MQMHTEQSLMRVHGLAPARPVEVPSIRAINADLVRRIAAGVAAHRARRQAMRDIEALHMMDDRLLADIGLTRGDIESGVRLGRKES